MADQYQHIISVAEKTTLLSSGGGMATGTALYFGVLSFPELIALLSLFVSALIGVTGVCVSAYFQRQRNRILMREQINKQGDEDVG